MSYVVRAAETIAAQLQPGQLVVLESTVWPGATATVVRPILERGGLRAGSDFFLGFSPEREDPGNESFGTRDIPKIVGADDKHTRERLAQF
jgi:UDP-N-acetyl-D-glucosamine dehydrogenase